MSNKPTLSSFFLSAVLTDNDRRDLVNHLSSLRENVFNTAVKSICIKELDSLPADYVTPLLEAAGASQDSIAANTIDQLASELSALPTAELTLAYKPTYKQLREILLFLRAKVSPNLIIKLNHEPQLTAGFVLEYQGQRADYSLETLMEK